MASSNKSFTIKSRTYGNVRATVPADTFKAVSSYKWFLDNPGEGRTLRARAYLEDGSRVNLQNFIYGSDHPLEALDGNFLNCSSSNICMR